MTTSLSFIQFHLIMTFVSLLLFVLSLQLAKRYDKYWTIYETSKMLSGAWALINIVVMLVHLYEPYMS
jgi:hypothetical protein